MQQWRVFPPLLELDSVKDCPTYSLGLVAVWRRSEPHTQKWVWLSFVDLQVKVEWECVSELLDTMMGAFIRDWVRIIHRELFEQLECCKDYFGMNIKRNGRQYPWIFMFYNGIRFSTYLLKRKLVANMVRFYIVQSVHVLKKWWKVNHFSLFWSWGRWSDILAHGRFKRPLKEADVETICRALLAYCLLHYRGDENIKSFIWDLITPSEDGTTKTLSNHSGNHTRARTHPHAHTHTRTHRHTN